MNTSSTETLHKYCLSLLNSVRANPTARCILLQRTATSVGHRCAHSIARQTESSTASTPQRVIRKKWNTSWHFTNLQNLKPETCSSKGMGYVRHSATPTNRAANEQIVACYSYTIPQQRYCFFLKYANTQAGGDAYVPSYFYGKAYMLRIV